MSVGRPAGVSLERRDIEIEQFVKIIEYVIEHPTMKRQTKSNVIKSCYLLYFFGLRVGELTFLTGKDAKKVISTKILSLGNNTKTKRPREAHIDPVHIGILEEVFAQELKEDDDYSLIRPWGKLKSQYNKSALQKLLNTVIHEALDSKQYTTHSFRAGYITELHRKGISIKTISKVIGHTKEATTMIYITVSDEEKREAVSERTVPPSLSDFVNKNNNK